MSTEKTPRNYSGGIPVNIRLSEDQHREIERAAEAAGLSKQDVIRLSIAAGLTDLKRINYKLGETISDAAFHAGKTERPEQEQLMHAAEAPAPYGKRLVARVRTDFDRKVTEVSPEFIKLCGHPSEEIIGHNLSEVVQGPGTEPDAVAKLRAALAKRKSVEVEITNHHKNGQPYKISLAIKPTPEGFEGEARLMP